MALQEQNIPISFSKGLNTKTDSKQTMPGQLLSMSNGVFTKINAINQDPGYLPIPTLMYNSPVTPRNIANGNSLNTFNGQLILTDSQFLYTFSETLQEWSQVPTKVATSIASSPIGKGAIGNTNIGVAKSASGLEFYTYGLLDTAIPGGASQLMMHGASVTIFDPISDNILYSASLVDSGFTFANPNNFQAISFGAGFSSLFNLISPTQGVYKLPVSETDPAPTLTPILVIAGSMQALVQSTTNVYMLYTTVNGGGGNNINLGRFDSSLTLINTIVVGTTPSSGDATAAYSLNIDPNTGNIIVAYSIAGVLSMGDYLPNLTAVTAAHGVITYSVDATAMSGVVTSATTMTLYIQQASTNNASTGYFDTNVVSVTIPTMVVGTNYLIFGTYIATEAYIFNSLPTINLGFFDYEPEAVTGTSELAQSVYFTVQPQINDSEYTGYNYPLPYTIIGKYSEGTAGAPIAPALLPALPNQVVVLSNTQTIIPYLLNQNPDIDSDISIGQYNVARLLETFGTHTRSVALGNNLNITGGVLSVYDGVGIAESMYHIFPWQLGAIFSAQTVVTPPAPSSLTAGETYAYTITYEWTDNYGNLHRSAPAITGINAQGVAAAPGTNQVSQAVITVNGTALSEMYKIFNIQVVLWRTAGNGSIFYRITSQPNVPGVITFLDFAPDSQIMGSTQLYTTGGEVENIGPAASDIIFPYKNRIIAVEADNPYIWWYSKQVIQGFPVEFSDFFTANIDMTGGPISAGYTMDDKLIFFKQSSIFYVIGDGPAPNGTANDFSYPQVITSDVGCANQDSIIVIPIGLMFQSTDKGIYLMDRSLSVQYIGAPVEGFNNIPVTSAQLLPNTTQVRFTLNNGTILIYDYLAAQWSTHTTLSFVDSTIYKLKHTGLQVNGQVLEQTQAQWVDITTPNPLSLTTGWFEFAQLQGYQRVKEFLLLLTSVNATSLQIQIFNDFETTPIQTDLIQVPATSTRVQYRIFPAFQKAQSMQIVITEIPTGAQAGGLLLSGMSFIAAQKRGLNKLPAVQAYG